MPDTSAQMDLLRRLALYLVSGVGEILSSRLLESFEDAEAVLCAPESDLCQVKGISRDKARGIRAAADLKAAEEELRRCEDAGISLLSVDAEAYPTRLGEIYSAPFFLYVKGDVSVLNQPSLAMVGSRRCNNYGQQQARRIASELASVGWCIVSGQARGIDSFAHQGALDAKGKTVAVLGTGIDVQFPKENDRLSAAIVENGGAIVTEFSFGVPPVAGNFPRRNRIISGLSRGTLVIQAGERSGALLTAGWALEQNRDVFVLPDRVDTPYSRGSHQLIQNGAKLVTSSHDILADYPEFTQPVAEEDREAATSRGLVLPETSQRILKLIGQEEIHIDDIVAVAELPASEVNAVLLRLHMSGFIRQLPGMFYQRK